MNGDGNSGGNGSTSNSGEEKINVSETELSSMKSAIKVPGFWDKTPQAWFIMIENIFRLKGVKSDTSKYQHVLASLPQHCVLSVLDIIKDQTNGYDDLKAALINRNSMSEEQRLNTLLSESNAVMGERRPSEFYRHLELLADSGTGVNNELLLKLWMRRLPSTLNVALVASNQSDSTALIAMADKIWDALNKETISSIHTSSVPQTSRLSNAIAPVQPSTSRTPDNQTVESIAALCAGISEMCTQVQSLRREISELKENQANPSYQGRQRSRQRNFSRHRSQNRSFSRGKSSESGVCWYHRRWGAKASRCTTPCQYNDDKSPVQSTSKNF